MSVQAIDENSPHLEAVKKLGKEHSKTLGFFPEGAFLDYAREEHILVSLDKDQCVGYLLYRIVRDKAAIAHFCVAEAYRGKGHARALLNHLIGATKKHRGIGLYCRRDYEVNKTWPRLGLSAIGEKAGRAVDGSVLDYWWLDHNHPDLFKVEDDPVALEVVIDFNIFRDLVESRVEESLGLQADWIRPLVRLCCTAEHLNEIQRIEDAEVRRQRRAELHQFGMVNSTAEAYQKAERVLKPLFPCLNRIQDESDFRHLVRALAADSDVFVTRDGPLLDRAEDVFNACGLSIVRPAELVGRIDVLQREREYQRQYVAGTRQVVQERIKRTEDALLDSIKTHGERKRDLAEAINKLIADPKRCGCHKLTTDSEPLAFYAIESDGDIERVPILRVCAKRKAGTVTRAVLTGIVRQAVRAGRKSVYLTETKLSDAVQAACTDLGFLPVKDGWVKLILRGWLPIDEVPASLAWTDHRIDELRQVLPAARTDSVIASQIEHLLFPGKLADAALPAYIVPIRPQFAEHLFDERLARGGVLGADVDLALNPESAYYRGGPSAGVACPGRVLWYVSEHELYQGTKAVRACSRIVELVRDRPKPLYQRFRRLGVYDFSQVLATADGDQSKIITAFRFDDSELLRPIGWNDLQTILHGHGVRTQLQGPVKIPAEAFGEIYAAALDSPKVR